MEDVLSVYKRPCDPDSPVVCPGVMPRQLIKEGREPIPAAPGRKGQAGLSLRAQRGGQPAYVLRAAGVLAHGDDPQAPDLRRLGPLHRPALD